jgi:hypothetical protein
MINNTLTTAHLLSRPVDAHTFRTGVKDFHTMQSIATKWQTSSGALPKSRVCYVPLESNETSAQHEARVLKLMQIIEAGIAAQK